MSHPVRPRVSPRWRVYSPTTPTDTPGRISFVYILQAQAHRDRVYGHLPLLWCVRIIVYPNQTVFISETGPSGDMYAPDFLAFLVMIVLTIKSRKSATKTRNILGVMAEDAALYFLVVFTSHFVLEMTLTLGRVSVTSPLRPRPTTSNACSPQESIQLLPAT